MPIVLVMVIGGSRDLVRWFRVSRGYARCYSTFVEAPAEVRSSRVRSRSGYATVLGTEYVFLRVIDRLSSLLYVRYRRRYWWLAVSEYRPSCQSEVNREAWTLFLSALLRLSQPLPLHHHVAPLPSLSFCDEHLGDVERLPLDQRPNTLSATAHRLHLQPPANPSVQGIPKEEWKPWRKGCRYPGGSA
jgi:hypothetical protein